MFQQKWELVEYDRLTRGRKVISHHWFRWTAEVMASRLEARHISQFSAWQQPRLTWKIDERCR